MRIRVLFFASLTDATGTPEITVEAPEHSTVGSMLGELTVRFPALEAYRGRILSAINARYAPRGAPLKDGDEVAFFPPVSGG
jgi:molybdopterin synthase sulfur carrier subunit